MQYQTNKILFKSLLITDFLFLKYTTLKLKNNKNFDFNKVKTFQIFLVETFKSLKQFIRLFQFKFFNSKKIFFFISETYIRDLLKEIFSFYEISTKNIELDFNFKKKMLNSFQLKILLFFGQYSWVSKNIFNMLLFRKLFLTQKLNLLIKKQDGFSYTFRNDFTSFKKIVFVGIFLSKILKEYEI